MKKKITDERKFTDEEKKFTDKESYTNKIKEKIRKKIIFLRRESVIVALSKRIIEL